MKKCLKVVMEKARIFLDTDVLINWIARMQAAKQEARRRAGVGCLYFNMQGAGQGWNSGVIGSEKYYDGTRIARMARIDTDKKINP